MRPFFLAAITDQKKDYDIKGMKIAQSYLKPVRLVMTTRLDCHSLPVDENSTYCVYDKREKALRLTKFT